MMASSVLVITFALLTALRPDPWYDPRYAIPLLGMILGNCMTGIALGLDTLTTGLMNRRDGVEARLMLGATRWQAARPVTRDALRSALMPIVNSMSATGVVSLPDMMTGQILSGVPPAEAVKYQILVMFLIAGGTGFGAVAAVIGGVYRLTDRRHRLRLDRLATVPASNAARQFCLALSLVLVTPAVASSESMLTLECQIPLGIVSGRIDHLALDLQRKRLFIAELGNDSVERDRSLRRWASIHLSVSHLREVICPVSGSTLTGRRSAAIHGTPISSSRCSSRSVRTVRRRHRRTSHRSTTPNHRNVKPMSGFAVAGAAMRSAVEFARIPHAIGGLPSL
jgi:hypothetical protein